MENILPILKYIFFHFDYFLIFIILLIWLFVNKKPGSWLGKKINKTGGLIYGGFGKLSQIRLWKLLLGLFVINFIIRFAMALVVPELGLACGDIMAPHYLNLAKSLLRGEGLTTHVIWLNYLEHPEIVRPDFFRVPFYPALMALSYFIFGKVHLSAQLINVMAGSLLLIFGFLLAFVLTKSKKISLLLTIFLSFNRSLLTWVAVATPELVYACCAVLILYFLYKTKQEKYGHIYALLTGVVWSLAYLTRTEGLFVFLPVILFFYIYEKIVDKAGLKKILLKIVITLVSFIIIASPYFIRNYNLTGNIIHSDFEKIAILPYAEYDYLVEAPQFEYKSIYQLIQDKPGRFFIIALKKI